VNAPQVKIAGSVFNFIWPDLGVEIELRRFAESKDTVSAEATVYSNLPPADGLLHMARLNLTSTQARRTMAKALEERLSLDWAAILEQLCFLALQYYRKGEPVLDLRQVQAQETRWILWPYLEEGQPTILFAFGGSGKSLLALAMAYTLATGQELVGRPERAGSVLYLDWETDAVVHRSRLDGLMAACARPLGPHTIFYKRMVAPLASVAEEIASEILRQKVIAVVVDSLGFAGGGAPEEAETAIAAFAAMRAWKVPVLAVHHRRKGQGQNGGDSQGLFGSAYYFNSARHVWQVEAARSEGEDRLSLGLIHVKANNGRLEKRHGYEVRFEADGSIRFLYRSDLTELPGLFEHASLPQRIMAELERGAKSLDELVESLDTDRSTLRARLSELARQGKILRLPENRFGLAA
jgi:hypothetical protein